MRLIEINPTLDLEVSLTTEEILADLVYPAHSTPLIKGSR